MNQYNNIYGSQTIPLSQIAKANEYESTLNTNIGANLKKQRDDQLQAALMSIIGGSLQNTQFFDRDGQAGALSQIYDNLTTGGSEQAIDDAAFDALKGGLSKGSSAAGQSGFTLSGIGAEGNYLLPAAGAFGLYDLFDNKHSGARSLAQGAASGAALGSYFGVPGTVIGGLLGAATGGIKKAFQGPSKTDKEQARFKKLYNDKSIDGFYDHDQIDALNTQIYDQFGVDGRGFVTLQDGRRIRVNNRFNKSRDENDLQGWDLVDRAAPYELYGKTFQDLPYEIRAEVMQGAIDRGLVREHHGTIDINRDEALDLAVNQAIADYKIKKAEEEQNKNKKRVVDDEL